jgi:hypothetical protein
MNYHTVGGLRQTRLETDTQPRPDQALLCILLDLVALLDMRQ